MVVVALTETALALSETLYGAESNTVEAGGTTRLLGVWASALCLTIVIAFPALISFLPKPVIAGLLFYLSVSMLLEWAIASRRRLPLYEYTLLLLILGATVLKGFLAGALLGLIACLRPVCLELRAGHLHQECFHRTKLPVPGSPNGPRRQAPC